MRICLCLGFFLPLFANVAVTYQESEGRFGDQLIGYLHAKWISYRYGIPLLYKPFLHSDEFALAETEELWTEEKEKSFAQKIEWNGDCSQRDALYIVPFFSDLEEDRIFHPEWLTLAIEWEDEGFRKLLATLFSPRKKNEPQITSHEAFFLTAALHIRRGGGADCAASYLLWPKRFPPDSYYIESLRRLSQLFPNRPIYAHIFTDDLNPKEIAEKFKKELAEIPITFSYREEGNGPKIHVMDDFFAMMRFDCLIRSASNYTLIPALIGDYKVVMTPRHGRWTVSGYLQAEYYVDEIEVLMGN